MTRLLTLSCVALWVTSSLFAQGTHRFGPEFRDNWRVDNAKPPFGDNPNGAWTYGSYQSTADTATIEADLTGVSGRDPYPLTAPDAQPVDSFMPYPRTGVPAGLKAWFHHPDRPSRRGAIEWRDGVGVWNPAWFGGPHWEEGMISFLVHHWRSAGVRFTVPNDGAYRIEATLENRNAGNADVPAGAPTDIRVIVTTNGVVDTDLSLLSRTLEDVPDGEGGSMDVDVPYSVAGIQVIGEDFVPDPALSITDQDILEAAATELERAEGADGNRVHLYQWPQMRLAELGQDPNSPIPLKEGDTVDFMASPRHWGDFQRVVAFEATITQTGLVEALGCERTEQESTTLTWILPDSVDSLRILRDDVEIATSLGGDPTIGADSTSFTDNDTPPFSHRYTVEAQLGALTETPSCSADDPTFGGVTGLTCDRLGNGETVTVNWTHNGPGYDTLALQINADDPMPLDPADTMFEDTNVPPGPRGYRIIVTWENDGAQSTVCSTADPRLVPPSELICERLVNPVGDDDVTLDWVNNGTGYDSIHIFRNDIEVAVLGATETGYQDVAPPGDADYEIKYTARVLADGPTCNLPDPDFPEGTRWKLSTLFPQSLEDQTNPIGVFTFGAYTGAGNEDPYEPDRSLADPDGLPLEFFLDYNTVHVPAGLVSWADTDVNAFGAIPLRPEDAPGVWNPGWSAGPHWEPGMINLVCGAHQSPTVRVTIPDDGNYFINATLENRNAGNGISAPAGSPTDIRVFVTVDGELDEDLSVLNRTVNVPGEGDVGVPVTVAGFQSKDRRNLGLPPVPDPRLGVTDQDILDGIATELERAEAGEDNRVFQWPQDVNKGAEGGTQFSAGDTIEFIASPRIFGHFQRAVAVQVTVQLEVEGSTPTGGCCVDGVCSQSTEADCDTAGGAYQGNGTICDTVVCPVDTGGCCVDGMCSELTEEDCLAMDGATYNGDESTCGAESCPSVGQSFRRGDCDQSGTMDFNDAIFHLKFLFLGENQDTVSLCTDACDSDDSGADDFTDDINTLKFLFLGQGNIPDPGPLPNETHPCGTDPTLEEPEELTCETYAPAIACP